MKEHYSITCSFSTLKWVLSSMSLRDVGPFLVLVLHVYSTHQWSQNTHYNVLVWSTHNSIWSQLEYSDDSIVGLDRGFSILHNVAAFLELLFDSFRMPFYMVKKSIEILSQRIIVEIRNTTERVICTTVKCSITLEGVPRQKKTEGLLLPRCTAQKATLSISLIFLQSRNWNHFTQY